MKVLETAISELKIIEPTVYGDERGFFMETFQEDWFKENIANIDFVQDNHSKSTRGILRGLHFQTDQTQGKLVRVISGEVFDVAVDCRKSSATFGRWVAVLLSAKNKKQFWIPPGFAHGFLVTTDEAEFVYKCTDYYNPESEISLKWNDKSLSIQWPNSIKPILSEKDENALSWLDIPYFD